MAELDPIPVTPGRKDMVDIYAMALLRLKAIVAGDYSGFESDIPFNSPYSRDAAREVRRSAAEKIYEIQRQIKWLKKQNAEWAEKYIPEAYQYGMYQDERLLRQVAGNKYDRTFSMLHREAAMVATEAAVADFDTVANAIETTYVGYVRRAQAEISKQAIARTIASGIIEGQNRQTTGRRLLEELSSQVKGGFITVGKVTMNAKTYADLLTRTLTRAARTDGVLNAMKEYDIDLVQINNTGAVDFCRIYEGQIFSISGKSNRFPKLVHRPPFHPNSYSKDTDVYTIEGWKKVSELTVNDFCLSLNPDTKQVEYVKVANTVSHESKDMVSFKSKNFDLLVTPNHQMLYTSDWQYKHNQKMVFVDADSLVGKKAGAIYRSCEWRGGNLDAVMLGDKTVTFDQYVRFMAWYLSEGCTVSGSNQVNIAQHRDKSPVTRDEIHSLLHEMGYDKHSHGKNGITVSNKVLSDELRKYGKCNDKYIPENIMNAGIEAITAFLETYAKADGNKKHSKRWKGGEFKDTVSYFTTSCRMAGQLGELILKAGMRPSFRLQKNKGKMVHHHNGDYAGNHDVWVINACHSQYAMLTNMTIELVLYNDMTYCVELEKYHTLWVRRNGKTCWCGNCTHSIHGYVLELSSEEETEFGSRFDPKDSELSIRELAKKYPQEKDDKRARMKGAA